MLAALVLARFRRLVADLLADGLDERSAWLVAAETLAEVARA